MSDTIRAPRVLQEALCARDLHLVGEISETVWLAEIVIGICLHNQATFLHRALDSALAQSVVTSGRAVILILDDASTDDWQSVHGNQLPDGVGLVVSGNCGMPARTRNALLDFVDTHFPLAKWVARLDADDVLANPAAVATLCDQGEAADARYVIGSNHLVRNGERLPWSNIADPAELTNPQALLNLIRGFAEGRIQRELPSCNLVLRTHTGIRYPEIRGAEDHWLVASLLVFQAEQGVIVPTPTYSIYTLQGVETVLNQGSAQWSPQRRRLAEAVHVWIRTLSSGKDVLGIGQEGMVWREGGLIWKEFYPWAMSRVDQQYLEATLARAPTCIPAPRWTRTLDGRLQCHYPEKSSREITGLIDADTVHAFLKSQFESGVVATNIKRANLRLSATGELQYIDIGKDIVPFTVSRFLDAAARSYGVCVLGLSDHELCRRRTLLRPHESLSALPGFQVFFGKLVQSCHGHLRLPLAADMPPPPRTAGDVSLLIKACAQDAATIEGQVEHIVGQLAYPASFASIMLLIDPYTGPFLRQYASGDLPAVLAAGRRLKAKGAVHEVLVAPEDPATIHSVYDRWFADASISVTHTTSMAPLFSQLWAFGKVKTRYVLQCDADVLIGRRDFLHDYLADMLEALAPEDVLGSGFNIPKALPGFVPYHARPGEFAPEIRLGLLDLERINRQLPIENPTVAGRFELMWHRALERHQRKEGLRCVRGGDSRSFYVHPLNPDKAGLDLPKLRDLVAQGVVPEQQEEKWDLVVDADWRYAPREEGIVFLLKGKDTAPDKLKRCFDSLRRQSDQDFGLIVIDDGGNLLANWQLPLLLGHLMARTTLIRRQVRVGYLPNFIEAVEVVCTDSDSLVVILDQDDALMSDQVVARLRDAISQGVDLVNGAMFRPDKPLHLYTPDYASPRETGGGNVWAHLRAFRKSLFERVPKDYFRLDDRWVDAVSDYAIMLPMAEMAQKPFFIDDIYCYYHQRAPYPATRKEMQFEVIAALLNKPSLVRSSAGESAVVQGDSHGD